MAVTKRNMAPARTHVQMRSWKSRYERATTLTEKVEPIEVIGLDLPVSEDPGATILATLAHDMRGYLTPIIGFTQTLIDHGASLTESERVEFLSGSLRNARELEHLLHEMVDLQRFDANGWILHRRPTDVRASIDRIMDDFDMGTGTLTITGDGPSVAIDPGLLKRIVENLVQNARTHTPEGSSITITTHSDGTGAWISVEDAGPGVPDDAKVAIFDAFRSGPAGGSGMGLALVKRFAALHGGRVWVEDGEGGGARFCVHLPGTATAPADNDGTTDRTDDRVPSEQIGGHHE